MWLHDFVAAYCCCCWKKKLTINGADEHQLSLQYDFVCLFVNTFMQRAAAVVVVVAAICILKRLTREKYNYKPPYCNFIAADIHVLYQHHAADG